MKKLPYDVPDGYFDSLPGRLVSVCVERRVRNRFLYVGVAACLAIAVVCGFLFSGGNRAADADYLYGDGGLAVSGLSADEVYEEFLYSDLIPETDPDLFFYDGSAEYYPDGTDEAGAGNDTLMIDDL